MGRAPWTHFVLSGGIGGRSMQQGLHSVRLAAPGDPLQPSAAPLNPGCAASRQSLQWLAARRARSWMRSTRRWAGALRGLNLRPGAQQRAAATGVLAEVMGDRLPCAAGGGGVPGGRVGG